MAKRNVRGLIALIHTDGTENVAIDVQVDSGLIKSDTVSPTARHRCDVCSELCFSSAELQTWAPPVVSRCGVIPRVQANEDLIFFLIW